MSDDNVAGKQLGRLLLAAVRLVCGAGIGVFLFIFVIGHIVRWTGRWDLASVSSFIMFVGASGLAAVFYGDRFIDWFLGVFFNR